MHMIRTVSVIVLLGISQLLTGCDSRPQVTGKWAGSGSFATEMSQSMFGGAKAKPPNAMLHITLLLNQDQKGGITGDADVVSDGHDMHIPITAGVIGKDGKLQVEAGQQQMGSVHLTLEGNATTNAISAHLDWKMSTFFGAAENKGPITLTKMN